MRHLTPATADQPYQADSGGSGHDMVWLDLSARTRAKVLSRYGTNQQDAIFHKLMIFDFSKKIVVFWDMQKCTFRDFFKSGQLVFFFLFGPF